MQRPSDFYTMFYDFPLTLRSSMYMSLITTLKASFFSFNFHSATFLFGVVFNIVEISYP